MGQTGQQALEYVRRRFGAVRLHTDFPAAESALTTGSFLLDLATGGYPRGRLVELFGSESSGKTTLALQAAAAVQAADGVAALIDADHALDIVHARSLGVKAQHLLCVQPNNGEEALEIAELLIGSNAVDLLIIDSVAALVPSAELQEQVGHAGSDGQVRLLEQGLRRLSSLVARSRSCLLFLNQLRVQGGRHSSGTMTSAGGNALKFYASLRIELRRAGAIQIKGKTSGVRIRARVIKNKLAAPYAQTDLCLDFTNGVDRCAEALELALQEGIVTFEATAEGRGEEVAEAKRLTVCDEAPHYGNRHFFAGEFLGCNQSEILACLRERSELQSKLEEHICRALLRHD